MDIGALHSMCNVCVSNGLSRGRRSKRERVGGELEGGILDISYWTLNIYIKMDENGGKGDD